MRAIAVSWLLLLAVAAAWAQSEQGPSDAKAQKTYQRAQEELTKHQDAFALDDFKKADKQDGGKCRACQQHIMYLGAVANDFKAADVAAQAMIAEASDPVSLAQAHNSRAMVLLREAMQKKKADLYAEADGEFKKALASAPNFPEAVYYDGIALATLNQDDEAKKQFLRYLTLASEDIPDRKRARRYAEHPELVRARLAPAFTVTTLDGQNVDLDDLTGKVVLIDFWATWCVPCREALPHLKEVAQKFQGQPMVILSVSLDSNEAQWKDFVAKNNMTWLQYRDGGFEGPVSKLFGVTAIPATFTIDADGVLEDQHVGDASIEGKLKKLCAQARELEKAPQSGQ